jgi:SAM-dependent methyltransferase
MEAAEVDKVAGDCRATHAANVAITGEDPDYFAKYKIADAVTPFESPAQVRAILDFGAGIGNSIPFFRQYFADSALTCCDVSERSIGCARERFPGSERFLLVARNHIDLPDASQDLVF